MKYIIHTDGGARGNPGPAAIGVVIEDERDGMVVAEFGKTIGETTNNTAEYQAVIEALNFLLRPEMRERGSVQSISFYLDSTLVVNQLNGLFKIKQPHLRELLMRVRVLEQQVGGQIQYAAVPREQNSRADFFVNQALDA
ncbi:ribonuclease HI family protein [Patescibacteria group bacterium]|nr:ribonuclease HI family protein [Patescibacteria group bacterium]